jgi:hypothetical protein
MGKRMLILRGNADNDGDQYPDENGKNVKWPIGALHVGAFKAIAKDKVNLDLWDAQKWKDGWELVYHTNPPRKLLPTTLPKKIREDVDTGQAYSALLLIFFTTPSAITRSIRRSSSGLFLAKYQRIHHTLYPPPEKR